ncbi:uncharacterized protein DS421_12g384820 [Arachis hypogaea]|nr:uncharacterized protein DS421_12g384820 [Arachis hypogaea]
MLLCISYTHLHPHDITLCTILYTNLGFRKYFYIFAVFVLIFSIMCYRLRCIFYDMSQDRRHHLTLGIHLFSSSRIKPSNSTLT